MKKMSSDKKAIVFVFFCMVLLMLTSCGSKQGAENAAPGKFQTNVLSPVNENITVYEGENVFIDASNASKGYIMLKYTAPIDKNIKARITREGGEIYTYDIFDSEEFYVLPLTQGSGNYKITVYKNISGNEYATVFAKNIAVAEIDEFLPFLYPNQYVDFTAQSKVVQTAAKLVENAQTELDVVSAVYNFTVKEISYDYEKAKTVQSGYLPVVDEILQNQTGICFDYAAVMCAMLRSHGIPTKLVIGYAGDVYHAWISVYIKNVGWVNDIIQFDGINWKLMDPTFDSTSQSDKKILEEINKGTNYIEKYSY